MAEVESADEFATSLEGALEPVDEEGVQLGPGAVTMIESRDTAIREALLNELEHRAVEHYQAGSGEGLAFRCALGDMRTKYQSSDSQPAQDGERR